MKKRLVIVSLMFLVVLGGGMYEYKIHNQKDVPQKITKQTNIEKKWLNELKIGNYTIDNPYIIQNPYNSNQLAAYVAFKYDEAVTYEYTVNGDIPFTYTSDSPSKTIIIPIVGLYNDTNNKIDISLSKDDQEVAKTTVEISTKDTTIDDEINTADIKTNSADELTSFMDGKFIIDNYTNIYDANGDLRASAIAPDSNYAYLKVIDNQFLVADKTSTDSKYNTMLFSYAITGRINPDVYFEAPKGTKFHHDFTKVGNKLYALVSSVSDDSDYANSYTESLFAVYSKKGKLENVIDMTDFYDVDATDLVNQGANVNDVHLNSLDYYKAGNLLIIDSRSYSQIIAYNLTTKSVEWILDDPATVGEDHQDLLLSTTGAMEYPSGEHTVFVANDYIPFAKKKDGMLYLSVFDNRQCVSEDGTEYTNELSEDPDFATCAEADDLNSRGIIYEIDLDNKTASTFDVIDFNSRTSFKGGFNLLADGYKTTYVANAHNFEIYNSDDELIGTYKLHTQENENITEDEAFLYRAVTFTTEQMQNFVEINN